MRLKKTLLTVVVAFATLVGAQAQDLHNTLFYMNPLHINPAFAGSFEGTFRIGGLYRDQARTVVTKAYSTPTIYGDAPILMIGKRHWIGVGLLMYQDKAGDVGLTYSSIQATGSFHYALDKKSKNILTLGVQYGQVTREIGDENAFNPEDKIRDGDITGTGVTMDLLLMEDDIQTNFPDWNVGFLLKSKANKKTDFNLGFSLGHLTRPKLDYNFKSSNANNGQEARLPMRLTLHGQLNTDLNKKWTLNPEFYYSRINPASQAQVHVWAGYKLPPKEGKDIKLNIGLGYRIADSGQVLLGIDYGDLKAQLGYDITLSSLRRANNRAGGFEVAVYYIAKVYKKPVVKPAILCPRL